MRKAFMFTLLLGAFMSFALSSFDTGPNINYEQYPGIGFVLPGTQVSSYVDEDIPAYMNNVETDEATIAFEHYCTISSPSAYDTEAGAANWVRSLRGLGYHVHSIDWGFNQGGVCCPDYWNPTVQVWTSAPCSTLTNDPLNSD